MTKKSVSDLKPVSDILLKTLLIYIKKIISDNKESCRIPFSIYFSLLSYLLITHCIFWLVKKKFIQVTRSSSIPNSIICFRSCFFEAWWNVAFISIEKTAAMFSSSYYFCIVYTSVTILSVANFLLGLSVCLVCNLDQLSKYRKSFLATTFFTILAIHFNKQMTQNDQLVQNLVYFFFQKYFSGFFLFFWMISYAYKMAEHICHLNLILI